jgi:cytochrome c
VTVHLRQLIVFSATSLAFSLAALPAWAVDEDKELKEIQGRGLAILMKNCAPCHAVERRGASPRADAPQFRTLGRRYPVESLEEALGEGIISGHPDMPEFIFTGEDVGAIIAYLKSIQE